MEHWVQVKPIYFDSRTLERYRMMSKDTIKISNLHGSEAGIHSQHLICDLIYETWYDGHTMVISTLLQSRIDIFFITI